MIRQSLFPQAFLAPPRKEGRSHPQSSDAAQRRRRTIASGFVVLSLVVVAFYVLHLSRRSSHGALRVGHTSAGAWRDVPVAHTTYPVDDMSSSTAEENAPSQPSVFPARKSDQLERHEYLHNVDALAHDNDEADDQHRIETRGQWLAHQNDGANHPVNARHTHEADQQHQFDRHVQPLAHRNHKAEEWDRFDQACKRVISLLPDELYMRELLRPFQGTGKERLRDIGLRARAFKGFFDAWEALHLVQNDGVAHLRQDVVQYLRAHGDVDTLAQTTRDYESFRHFFQRLSRLLFPWTAPYFSDHMSLHAHIRGGGRGIVLTAGDKQAPYLLASIPSFRQLGCTLPIEIMYLGDADLSQDYRAELETLPGVITRDLSQMVDDEGWRLAGWAAKPFAMLLSSFQEIIFIDADSLFFIDPTLLFDDPLYQESGALFFRDRLLLPESKKRWLQEILAKPVSKQVMQSRLWRGESAHMQESGVLVVDKWRHFVALLMVTRMNGPDRDGNEDEGTIGVYDMVYGDKETFWIGWELVGDRDYEFHPGDAGIMGIVEDEEWPEDSDETNEENGEKDEDDNASKEDEEQVEDAQTSEEGAEDTAPEENEEQAEGAQMDDEGTDETASEKSEESDDQEVEASESDQETAPEDEYTICAPQLLHLDTNGRPLWFNGWVLDNKFSKDKNFGRFDVYMKEPREIQEPGAWEIEKDNMCCLTNDEVFEFTEGEKDVLDMIIGLAKGVREHGRG